MVTESVSHFDIYVAFRVIAFIVTLACCAINLSIWATKSMNKSYTNAGRHNGRWFAFWLALLILQYYLPLDKFL
jgi:hypothetical protein